MPDTVAPDEPQSTGCIEKLRKSGWHIAGSVPSNQRIAYLLGPEIKETVSESCIFHLRSNRRIPARTA